MAKSKSIWRSIDEKPTKDCSILICYDEEDDYTVANYSAYWDTVFTDEAPDGESWKWGEPFYQFDRWCYINDLKDL